MTRWAYSTRLVRTRPYEAWSWQTQTKTAQQVIDWLLATKYLERTIVSSSLLLTSLQTNTPLYRGLTSSLRDMYVAAKQERERQEELRICNVRQGSSPLFRLACPLRIYIFELGWPNSRVPYAINKPILPMYGLTIQQRTGYEMNLNQVLLETEVNEITLVFEGVKQQVQLKQLKPPPSPPSPSPQSPFPVPPSSLLATIVSSLPPSLAQPRVYTPLQQPITSLVPLSCTLSDAVQQHLPRVLVDLVNDYYPVYVLTWYDYCIAVLTLFGKELSVPERMSLEIYSQYLWGYLRSKHTWSKDIHLTETHFDNSTCTMTFSLQVSSREV